MNDANPVGRPPKFSAAEIEARTIGAATTALETDGLSHGLDAIRLDRAIALAAVPRGAAYRVWERDTTLSPQDALRRGTLIHLLRSTPLGTGLEATRDGALNELAKHSAALASNDPHQLRVAQSEMIRVVGALNFNNIRDNQHWRIYQAASVTATTQTEPDAEIVTTLRTAEEGLIQAYAEFFADMAALFGLALRPGLEINEFSFSAYALNEGLANRPSRNYRLDGIERPTGPDGAMRSWTLFAIGFEALVNQFFEPLAS